MPASTSSTGVLSASQRRYLRGLCHSLRPVILLGAKGVSDAVTKELELALDQHELVKIKLSGGDRDQRQQQIDALTEATGAQMVQQIGHTASVFRRNEDEPRLALPR
jgi:RNA-binding protein